MVKKCSWANVLYILFLFFFLQNASAQSQIYYHNFDTQNPTHPYTVAPSVLATNLSGSSWTNTNNAWTNFGGNSGQAITIETANNQSITLTVSVATGYQVAISSFDFWRQRSSSGPQSWAMTINGTAVGNGTVPTSGAMLGVTPVSNTISGITGTLRVVIALSGASGNGNFRLDDFTLNGLVTPTCTAPVVSSFTPASGPQNTLVTINGSGFTGASGVRFGPVVSTTYNVISDTQLTAVVPAGAGNTVTVLGPSACPGTALTNFTFLESNCAPPPAEIYISEVYDEKPGDPGAAELYNPTAVGVSLDGVYTLERYQNVTDTSPVASYTLALTGIIAPYSTYLVRYGTDTTTCFNGLTFGASFSSGINENDAIKLKKNGVVKDVANAPNLQGYSLIRNPNAAAPSDTFNASDWTILSATGATFMSCSDLGRHTTDPNVITPPSITSPANVTVCEGATAVFSVQVTPSGSYTYQWKMLNASGAWINVTNNTVFSGATTNTLTVNPTVSMNGVQFYCQVTTSACTLISNAATLYVSQSPAAPAVTTTQPDCTTPTGTITVTLVSGATYSIDGANYVSNNVFSGLTPATYPVTIRNAAGCTSAVTSVTISAAPSAPAAPTVTTTQPDCTTSTGTITVTPVSGATYSIDGSNYVSNNVFSGLTPATYPVTIRNAAGCTSAITSVTISAAPSAPAAPTVTTNQPDCTTSTGTITVTLVSGATYSIDGSNYVSNNLFSGLTPATYPVTIRNAAGCTSAVTSVTISAAPSAPVAPAVTTTQPDCTTSTGTITITLVSGATYSIDGTNYLSNNVFSGLTPATYPVTIRNAAGCTSAITNVVISASSTLPQPVVSTIQPTCAVPSGTITIALTAGFTYSIDGVNYVSNNSFSGLTPGNYQVTVKSASGCFSQPRTVVINTVPVPPSAPTVTVSHPDCSVATGSISVTPVTGGSYSINGTTYVSNPVFSNLAPGSYSVTVRTTGGCISTATIATINAAPLTPLQPQATAVQPDCTTPTGTITVTPVAGVTYSIDGINYSTNNIFSGLTPGNYAVTVKNTAGCVSPVFNVVINTAPLTPAAPVVTANQPGCGMTTGSMSIAPISGVRYSIDGVNYQSLPTFTGLAPGSYNVTVRNNAGCVSPVSIVTINTPPVQPSAPDAITGGTTVCKDDSLQLNSTTTGGTWTVNNTNIATIDSNGLLTALRQGSVTVSYTVGTVCQAATSVVVTVFVAPTPRLNPDYFVCKDNVTGQMGTVYINCGVSGLGYSFVWERDGQDLSIDAPWIDASVPGDYKVTVTNQAGCVGSASTTVKESSKAIGYAEVGEDFHSFQTITVHVTGGSGEYVYSLDYGPYQTAPYFTNVTQGVHFITVNDVNGCGQLSLSVLALDYPKFFTPNNDGLNDYWNISGLTRQSSIIYIFDRYGKLITSVLPGTQGWDGTLNGYPLPATDYWFKVLYKDAEGDSKEFKAHFSLIR